MVFDDYQMKESRQMNEPDRGFEGWSDREAISRKLDSALSDADDGELYIQQSQSESLSFMDGRLNASSFNTDQGFGLRTVCGDQIGYGHSNEFSEAAFDRAVEAASIAKKGQSGNWDVSPDRTNRQLYRQDNPIDTVPFATKVKLLEQVNAYARGKDPRVVQVMAGMNASWSGIEIVRPGGERYRDIRPMAQFRVQVVMAENGRSESGMSGDGGRFGFNRYLNEDVWQAQVDEAIRMAVVNLGSKPAPAGVMDIVLGAGWPGVMLHEAVGHGLEGDAIRKGMSAYSGKKGEQVAAQGVTIVDEGDMDERRGSLSIDDEGTPCERTVLIEDGVLTGHMQDRQNARLMGEKPTGNARRESYAHLPMPRMTNTYMENGTVDPKEILSSVKDGIYAVNFGGGQVDITSGNFVFSCTEAYRVKNGEQQEAIKGATLIGSGPEAMRRVSMIGNDLALDPGIAVCGKAGQSVPVCVGQPTLKMDQITVGGTN